MLATCKKPRDFERIDALVERIDEVNDLAEPQLYVYSVRNGEAGELSDLLTTVFQKSQSNKDKKSDLKASTPTPDAETAKKGDAKEILSSHFACLFCNAMSTKKIY